MVFDPQFPHILPERDDYPLHDWQHYAFSRFAQGLELDAFNEDGGIGIKRWEQRCLAARIAGNHNEGTVWVSRLADEQGEPSGYSLVTVSHPMNPALNAFTLAMNDGLLRVEALRSEHFDPNDLRTLRRLDETLTYARTRYASTADYPMSE